MKKSEPTKHAIQLFYQLYTPISRKKGSKVEWVFSKSVGESSAFYGNWMKSSAKVSASHQFLWEFDEVFSESVGKSSVFMGIGWSQCWINRWAGAQSAKFCIHNNSTCWHCQVISKLFPLEKKRKYSFPFKLENILMLILVSCGQFLGSKVNTNPRKWKWAMRMQFFTTSAAWFFDFEFW